MWSFQFWLLLREQLDRDAYNDLFRQELERLLSRLTDPIQRQHAEGTREFDWTRYMAGAIRRPTGITSQDEIDDWVHEIVIRILVSRADCSEITMSGDMGLSRCGSRGH
jgi:hypothetical protein